MHCTFVGLRSPGLREVKTMAEMEASKAVKRDGGGEPEEPVAAAAEARGGL